MGTINIAIPENAQDPTPEWYSAQVQKLCDIRGFLYGLIKEDSGSDESLPDMVKRMFLELQADLTTANEENERLREILSKTAESFRQNNRSLTANQHNAWESIEKELAPKSTCVCKSYFMRTHEHIPGCPALKEVKL